MKFIICSPPFVNKSFDNPMSTSNITGLGVLRILKIKKNKKR